MTTTWSARALRLGCCRLSTTSSEKEGAQGEMGEDELAIGICKQVASYKT